MSSYQKKKAALKKRFNERAANSILNHRLKSAEQFMYNIDRIAAKYEKKTAEGKCDRVEIDFETNTLHKRFADVTDEEVREAEKQLGRMACGQTNTVYATPCLPESGDAPPRVINAIAKLNEDFESKFSKKYPEWSEFGEPCEPIVEEPDDAVVAPFKANNLMVPSYQDMVSAPAQPLRPIQGSGSNVSHTVSETVNICLTPRSARNPLRALEKMGVEPWILECQREAQQTAAMQEKEKAAVAQELASLSTRNAMFIESNKLAICDSADGGEPVSAPSTPKREQELTECGGSQMLFLDSAASRSPSPAFSQTAPMLAVSTLTPPLATAHSMRSIDALLAFGANGAISPSRAPPSLATPSLATAGTMRSIDTFLGFDAHTTAATGSSDVSQASRSSDPGSLPRRISPRIAARPAVNYASSSGKPASTKADAKRKGEQETSVRSKRPRGTPSPTDDLGRSCTPPSDGDDSPPASERGPASQPTQERLEEWQSVASQLTTNNDFETDRYVEGCDRRIRQVYASAKETNSQRKAGYRM